MAVSFRLPKPKPVKPKPPPAPRPRPSPAAGAGAGAGAVGGAALGGSALIFGSLATAGAQIAAMKIGSDTLEETLSTLSSNPMLLGAVVGVLALVLLR